jgi:YVTN family beta-propeller protein
VARRARAARGRALIAAGGALLLAAAIAAGIVELAGGEATVLAAPDTVAVIDTSTDRVSGAVAVGARPGAITFDAGSLWVGNQDDQTVSRVDPTTLRTVRTISLAEPPTGIAANGEGVWVASSSPSAAFVSISRIDPQFDAVDRTIRVGNVVPGTPAAITARAGALWVAPFSGELTRLDPRTGHVIKQVDPNAAPSGVDFDTSAVWVSDGDAGTVTRIDPTGLTTPVAVGHDPSAIAVGDGGVWVADTGDGAVVRIDPDTRAVTATIPVGHAPTGVALGAGSVWVADSGDGTVTRIDPVTEKVTATIRVGDSPQAIAVAGGRAWVTVDSPAIPAAVAAAGGTLRLDSSTDVSSMDPALAYDGLSFQLLYATCAKLLNYPDKPGPAGSQLVPEVAQALPERSVDGRTYTFAIRPGFRFSPPSNEPVTAETFRYTIERTLNPRMRSPIASEFRDIVGVGAYRAGKTTHIAGVSAEGNNLTIRLTAPSPDLPTRIAETAFCAVPSDTPIDPHGVRVIPSAGPYRVASYTPGQGLVLTRNLNYHGNRPHRLERIEVAVGIPDQRAGAQVQSGAADYAAGGVPAAAATRLAARYGPASPAARAGHQQYFLNPLPQLDFFALNTHRPLFANVRLRQAVSYAIERAALARLGDEYVPLPEHPTDHYLPPGIPGYTNIHPYPPSPDPAKARELAKGHTPATAILYTCDVSPCDQQAQIIKTDLAAIGIQIQVKAYPDQILYTKTVKPSEPFDIATVGWIADYPDPDAILNVLLEDATIIPKFKDPTSQTRLAAAARLTGPERYLTYARLDADLARNAAPLVAFGNLSSDDFFSARIGCQTFGAYGIDLAALSIRRTGR